jgi:hypothetical protein
MGQACIMIEEKIVHTDDPPRNPGQKLLVSHAIRLQHAANLVEVERGMRLVAQDSVEVGAVAALVFDCAGQEVTHILLGYLPPTAVYRLIPLSLVDRVEGALVRLKVGSAECAHLPIHEPER